MSVALDNVFAAEPLIIERIQEYVPDLATVASASMLAVVDDIAPLLPAAFVLPAEGEEGPNDKGSAHKVEVQRWQVAICVAHVNDHLQVTSAAFVAGKFIRQVCGALMAWRPVPDEDAPNEYKPFIWAGRATPFYEIGYAQFPIFFTTEIVLRAN